MPNDVFCRKKICSYNKGGLCKAAVIWLHYPRPKEFACVPFKTVEHFERVRPLLERELVVKVRGDAHRANFKN